MSYEILVTIAGAQGTEVSSLSRAILNSVTDKVEVIQLDKLILNSEARRYDYHDYNFSQIKQYINETFTKMESKIKIIILCGCYALYDKEINKLSQLKIFMECDSDKRLINLIKDTDPLDSLTTNNLSNLLKEYMDNIREEMNKYVLPTRQFADIIIPQNNDILGQLIVVDGIKHLIKEKEQYVLTETAKEPFRKKTTSDDKMYWNYQKELLDLEKNRYLDLS